MKFLSALETILSRRQRLLQTCACEWFKGSSVKRFRAGFFKRGTSAGLMCEESVSVGTTYRMHGLLKKERPRADFQVSQWKRLSVFFLSAVNVVEWSFRKVVKRTRINLSRLRVSIILPLDHADTFLLKPAIRCASTSMFASLLRQSCRQVSPAVALLSANMQVNNQPADPYLFGLNGEEAAWLDGFLLGDLWVAAASSGQSNLCEMSPGFICNCSINYRCMEGMRGGKCISLSLL